MKVKKYITVLSLCAAAAVGMRRWLRTKPGKQEAPAEADFHSRWQEVLLTDARVFNGLYSGLYRVCTGAAKKPEKVLREWCLRTRYRWENQPVDDLCQRRILPDVEKADGAALALWAERLLLAAKAAGITMEEKENLVLTHSSMDDYVEWNGEPLEPGDTVRVRTPAWYQSGVLLEQGQCEK